MSALFGDGGGGQSDAQPDLGGIRIQTSALGVPFPLVFGRNRVAPNIIWAGGFSATPRQSASGGKGGGGGYTTTGYNYSCQAAFALGYGVVDWLNVWINKSKFSAADLSGQIFGPVAQYNYEHFTGSTSQVPWTLLTSGYPGQDLFYRRLAYVGADYVDMGSSPRMPNHTFEVDGLCQNLLAFGVYDADPSDVTTFIATDSFAGAGFASANLGDFTQWSNFCRAAGILVSPAYVTKTTAAEMIKRLADISNTGVYFSEGKLKATPLSDVAATGNGRTYTPNVTPVYDLDDSVFENKDDPVEVVRSDPADAFNTLTVKIKDRSIDYADNIGEGKDQASLDLNGPRPADDVDYATEIADVAVAGKVAQQLLQRMLYMRNQYRFVLSLRFFLLEPTDLVTLTDTYLGLNRKLCRVLQIEETDDYKLRVTVEEVPANVSAPATYPSQAAASGGQDLNIDPGDTTAVVIDAPGVLAPSGFELWIPASGGANWGGAVVWVSLDGGASYQVAGTVTSRGRFGTLTGTYPSGPDPDTVDTLSVDLTTSRGTMDGAAQAQADAFATLALAGNELVAYSVAALTSTYHYDLTTYIRRGVYNTPIGSHPGGTTFARLDPDTLFKYAYDPKLVGQTVYVKLQSFNQYQVNYQDLATVTPIAHVIAGPIGAPDAPTGFVVQQQSTFCHFSVDKVNTVYLDRVEIRYADPGETMWENGIPVVNILRGFTDTNGTVPPGTWRFMARAYDRAGNPSLTWAVFDFTVTAEGFTQILSVEAASSFSYRQRENWLGASDAINDATADWQSLNSTDLANQAVDMFGALTMSKVIENTASVNHGINQFMTSAPAANWADNAIVTASVYAIKGERTWVAIDIRGKDGTLRQAWFNLSTGQVGTVSGPGSPVARISKQYASGGYLCSLSSNVLTGTGAQTIRLRLATGDGVTGYLGDGVSGAYFGNASVVMGSYQRDYLPTADGGRVVTPHGNFSMGVTAMNPDSQNYAGDLTDAQLWDEYCYGAYATCTYEQPQMDKGVDASARVWNDVVANLGVGETAGVANPQPKIDYRTSSGSFSGYQNWTIGSPLFRYLKAEIVLTTANGKARITGFETVIDKQPVTETGTYTTDGSGTVSVGFTNVFHNAPGLQVSAQGSGDVAASFTGLSRTGFTGLFKSAGVAAAGTASYSAVGV